MGVAMKLITGNEVVAAELQGGVAAIGNFDGVHRGHQVLLGAAAKTACELGGHWGLITFDPHPKSFFRPHEPVFRLTPNPLKARLIGALGAQFMVTLTFDAALASLSPGEFVRRELVERLHVRHVVTGYDFHFGKGRKGSPDTMRALGNEFGFGVSIIEQVTDDDGLAPFASSAIRDALRHGHVQDAAHQLGYHWTVMGEVQRGDQRGRTIGFPTINILLERGAEPFHGIYAVRVRTTNGSPAKIWAGAGYFGQRPTFDSERTFLEVFLLDYSGDLYGETLMVEFIDLIRPDRKFDSIDDLVNQMAADCKEAKKRLAAIESGDPIAAFPLGKLQRDGLL
jgi:riboflavin kinase/FMN adenylyltransferase